MTTKTDPYAWMHRAMAQHGKTKIDNHTYLERDTDVDGETVLYSIVLHDTAILTFDPANENVQVDSGGYRTNLTLRRLNTYLEPFRVKVVSHSGLWLIERSWEPDTQLLFEDGLVVVLAP